MNGRLCLLDIAKQKRSSSHDAKELSKSVMLQISVTDLRRVCEIVGLPSVGHKPVLIEMLQMHFKEAEDQFAQDFLRTISELDDQVAKLKEEAKELRGAVVRVIRREIAALRHAGDSTSSNGKRKKKKKSKKDQKSGKEMDAIASKLRVPWKKLSALASSSSSSSSSGGSGGSSVRERRLRSCAAAAYRFYFREYISAGDEENEEVVGDILRRCRKEHTHAVSVSDKGEIMGEEEMNSGDSEDSGDSGDSGDVVLLLERYRMRRERCAALRQRKEERYNDFVQRARGEREVLAENVSMLCARGKKF